METYKASDFAKAGVFPRRVSAEGPPRFARGDKK